MKTKFIAFKFSNEKDVKNLLEFCNKNKVINISNRNNGIYTIEYIPCIKDRILDILDDFFEKIIYYFVDKGLYNEEKYNELLENCNKNNKIS